MIDLQECVLNTLQTIIDKKEQYRVANDTLRQLQGDLCNYITPIDTIIESKIVELMDKILGDEMASYFLYECDRGGGKIETNGKNYPIKSIDDLRFYLNDTKNSTTA